MIIMDNPFKSLTHWLNEERNAGAPNPQQAILTTVASNAIPHSRVVAIREIKNEELLFFTQKGTRKVSELTANPAATLVFWFELFQREVIIEGNAVPISESENNFYWQQYPREAQIRFCSYAPTSTQIINDKNILESKKKLIEQEYATQPLPISPYYCGFRLKPSRIIFYAYRTDELSDVHEFTLIDQRWVKQLLSP